MAYTTTIGPNGITLVVVDEDAKTDIRRWCGFGSYGFGISGYWFSGNYLRTFQSIELRMNSFTVSEYDRITGMFAPNLRQLEADLINLRTLVLVDKAAVFTRNKDEAKERHNEYAWWRNQLCQFMGIDPGPHLSGKNSNTMNIIAG